MSIIRNFEVSCTIHLSAGVFYLSEAHFLPHPQAIFLVTPKDSVALHIIRIINLAMFFFDFGMLSPEYGLRFSHFRQSFVTAAHL
jgi:hypothetical protein